MFIRYCFIEMFPSRKFKKIIVDTSSNFIYNKYCIGSVFGLGTDERSFRIVMKKRMKKIRYTGGSS